MLALLPAQNTHQQEIVKAKALVVVVDHAQGFAAADGAQKSETETEDPHPLIFCYLALPAAPVVPSPHFSSAVLTDNGAYYPIRAPPFQA